MARRSFSCPYDSCDLVFDDRTDQMIHASEHSGRGERIRRRPSCWRCAAEIEDIAGLCTCGFQHPYLAAEASQ